MTGLALVYSPPVLYDMYHVISDGSFDGRPERSNNRHRPDPGSLLQFPADNGPRRIGGDGNAGHQYPVAVAAADGGVPQSVERGGHLGHHDLPRRVPAPPTPGPSDLRSLPPAA